MKSCSETTLNVISKQDIPLVKLTAKSFLLNLNISFNEIEKILVASIEAANNIINHSDGGVLKFSVKPELGHHRFQILTKNKFTKHIDFEHAIGEGFSTAGSLGSGLGIINDIMDEMYFDIEDQFVTMTFIKNIRFKSEEIWKSPLDIGAATRAHPKMKVNGDAMFIKSWDNYSLFCIIDGLGHGQFAARASNKAKLYLDNHYSLSMQNIFLGIGRACRSTRGAVVGIAKIDFKSNILTYAGVGNISINLYGYEKPPRFINQRGIMGVKNMIPHTQEAVWQEDAIMIMYSDGISYSSMQRNILDLNLQSSSLIARNVLAKFSKNEDDATVIVVKGWKNV